MAKKNRIIEDSSSIAQARLMRVLQVIALLKSGHWNIKELCAKTDTKERTMYRYLSLISAVDFILEKDFQDKYFIFTSENESNGTHFTLEEMKIIKKLIQAGVGANPIKDSILKKLSLNSELDSMPRMFINARIGKLMEHLAKAIESKQQVVIKNYHSANSGQVSDRLVEPYQFGDNYQTVFALDTKDKTCKQFKLDRIGEVIEMSKSFKFETLHAKHQADIFGFVGDVNEMITLQMTMKANLLLREEFPLSIPYITKLENEYQFHGPVSHLEGITRFVLGLIDEIVVVKPKSFKTFIDDKIKKRRN